MLLKRNRPDLSGVIVPLGATALALLIGGVFILLLGANPIVGYWELAKGAFGGVDELADTATKAMPLLLVGTGISIAFRAKVINIGGEGQIIAGAILSTMAALAVPDLPAVLLVPLVMLAGFVGGGIWGAVPGALKAYLGVNEILSTIMLNIVAIQIASYLLKDPLIDKNQAGGANIPQTVRLSENADLPILIPGTRLHLGIVVALLAAVGAWIFLWRTKWGYRVRAVGESREAATYAGIPVKRMTMLALTLSGAMCGLAGAVLVFGSESHRLYIDGSSAGFTGSAGFNGIVTALFGGLHPLWTIPSSFLFGGLLVGANAMQRAIEIPSFLVGVLNGLVVIFVVSAERYKAQLGRYLTRNNTDPASTESQESPPSDDEFGVTEGAST